MRSAHSIIRKFSSKLFDSKLTTLESGLRVVTEPVFGEYCTVGVGINAGSRYETHYPLGVSHFLEKLAFSSSEFFIDNKQLFATLEEKGALIDCQSTKDTFLFASSCNKNNVEEIMEIIASAVHRPLFNKESIEHASQAIKFENEAMERRPDCEPLLTDWIHEAAFRNNTLGFPKYCKSSDVDNIELNDLYSFLSQYFTPDRMVVAGVGVNHLDMVNLSSRIFNPKKTIWAQKLYLITEEPPPLDLSFSQYTGGEIRKKRDLSTIALGPTPFPNLAHLVLGFEGVSVRHPDFVIFCVLQSLLGGGGSFSAGGPGKGMYARLYTDVMNHYHWIYNATAFNHSYTDSGLFCIRASSPPENLLDASKVVLNEFLRLSHQDIDEEELERAKMQLKSQLMMNLEMRPVIFEDMIRQVLAHNERRSPHNYLRKIDAVQPADIRRVIDQMLATQPSLVGYGNLDKMPTFEKFDRAIAERSPNELDPNRSFFTS